MSPILVLVLYCLTIVGASLFGGHLPSLMRLTHTRMQLMISFVGGLMLGIGIFHLLPHSINESVSLDRAVWWMMVGLIVMFFLLRIFHFHHHGTAEEEGTDPQAEAEHAHDHGSHSHDDHDHAHDHSPSSKRFSWVGVAIGLALHTAIDGIALAAAVMADAAHGMPIPLYGLGIFLAVLLHKPLDALSITSLMADAGWPPESRQKVNAAYAMMCPIGALLFYFGVDGTGEFQTVLIGCALAFSAGVFVCISLGDLLPELSFHSHDRVKLSFALMLGVVLAYAIGFVEPHLHGPDGRTLNLPSASSSAE